MKKTFVLLIALLSTTMTFSQAPEKMSYQAVIRDGSDVLISNQPVGMQISILQTTATGISIYTETQTPTTNVNGLVSVEIGTGTTSDDFSAIDWSAGPYFIKTETDPTGGSTYTITGTSQLLSVPYALHAKTAGILTNPLYQGNSSTSLDISSFGDCSFQYPGCATGTASIVTDTELAYSSGMRIRLSSILDPENNFIEGVISSYDGSNMDIAVDWNRGSSTITSWNINIGSGKPGFPGPQGQNGQTAAECFDYTFDSSTAAANPFNGNLRFNSTDLANTTQIYIHNEDSNSNNQSNYFNLIGFNESTIIGTIMVSQDEFGTNNWSLFAINNVTDNMGYQTLDVSYLSGVTTPFTDFNPIAVCFGRTGDKGDSGAGALNTLGPVGALSPAEGSTSALSGGNNPPVNGDEWVNRDTGERFVYSPANGWELEPNSFQLSDNTDDTATTTFNGVTGPSLISSPAADGIFVWNQDGATGTWVDEQSFDGKNILGPPGVSDPSLDVFNPTEGDQWVNKETGESFIYQEGIWHAVPTISNNMVSSTLTASTTSATYIVLNGMTITPEVGTYMVSFSASGNASSASAGCDYSIFIGGSLVSDSYRKLMYNGGAGSNGVEHSMHSQSIVAVNGSQAIDVRYKTSSGTFTVNARNMILLKVN